jgi:hypothetical protein
MGFFSVVVKCDRANCFIWSPHLTMPCLYQRIWFGTRGLIIARADLVGVRYGGAWGRNWTERLPIQFGWLARAA